MKNNVIAVEGVSKCFKIYNDKPLSLKERIVQRRRTAYSDYWALKKISFFVKQGETVGLIGKNGSGKSTMLKLLSRIIYPSEGQIVINGRVAGLLELGAGFQPDFTGRENVFLNASILGFTKKEISSKMDDIIQFSEIGNFIDTPVRNYSSGMYMRLAFSIAISVQPQILLIDEVLSVGDAGFQKKCFDKLNQLKDSGVTIVLVSHSAGTVESFCDRAIWLHDGVLKEDGNAKSVVNSYTRYMAG